MHYHKTTDEWLGAKQGKTECSLRGSYSALPNIKKKKKQKNSATATYIEALRWKSNHVERVIAVKGSHQAMVVGIKFNIRREQWMYFYCK